MRIVFAASEAAPFVKTGGLGDVAQALPKALSEQKGNEVCLFLPYYKSIKNNPEFDIQFVKSFSVDVSWRKQHVGVFQFKSRKRKLKIFFIDNEYYFGRDGYYGYPDDGERFAFYTKAILQSLVELGIEPDIIQCNDWQTALIPIFLHSFYGQALGRAKVVFTIHNIEYQGKADPYFLGDTLGLPQSYENALTFDKCINFMKGAILKSDSVTTVSETYANDIRNPYFAHGLSSVINQHIFKLSGIVNGIDTELFNPATDKALFKNYSLSSVKQGKAANKKKVQENLGLDVRADVPLIGMMSRLVAHKGIDLVCEAIYELMGWDVQIVIIGTGEQKYENYLAECAGRNSAKFFYKSTFDVNLASQVYAASDIYLMPSKSEPCGLSQLIAMRYGSVPVVNETGGLKDTVPAYNGETGVGKGFTFQSFTCGDMLDALRRCLSVYGGSKKEWAHIVENAMGDDYSWNESAKKYMMLYEGLCQGIGE